MADLPKCPRGRTEEYLADIAGLSDSAPDKPWSRKEAYLDAIDGRLDDIEEEIETIKDNPDVADIVDTYADLESYDTSTLTDKDVIRVLNDETHDGNSTYYRYSKTTDSFTYIGSSKTYDVFVGTDGTTAGTAGLVPAPATTDAGKILSASGSWMTPDAGIKTLTTADYNYHAGGVSDDAIGLWLLDDGVYSWEEGVHTTAASSESWTNLAGFAVITSKSSTHKYILRALRNGNYQIRVTNKTTGAIESQATMLVRSNVQDNLTSTFTDVPLSANQGRVLKGLIDSLVIKNVGAPTTSTVGAIGQLLEDTTNGKLYQCTAIDNTDPQNIVYTWTEVGGSSVNVVQTIGTSTTDVMSQKAVTNMVFDTDTSNQISIGCKQNSNNKIWIGNSLAKNHSLASIGSGGILIGLYGSLSGSPLIGANAIVISQDAWNSSAPGAIVLGNNTSGNYQGSIRLGYGSAVSAVGQMDIGSTNTAYGYNSSNYRLLTGLYDPQSAHDAATKGYVDGTTETLTIADTDWSALSSSDPYTYSATKTLTATIGANSTVELINDAAVDFATYGFAIGAVDTANNTVTFYSIGAPSASKTLKVNVKG